MLAALGKRMAEAGLELHPDKTRIVYCKDDSRRGPWDGICGSPGVKFPGPPDHRLRIRGRYYHGH
ncbi:MAG TPA: hypothetical protein VF482_18200 [Trebonia sp.]